MTRKISKKVILLVILAATLILYFPLKNAMNRSRSAKELNERKATFADDSSKLERTVILPAMNTPIIPNRNIVWCSSFQLAWNEMKDMVIKNPIQVSGAEGISQRLNNANQQKSDLSEDSYYVAAGKTSDNIQEKIRSDMARRFPSVEVPEFGPNDVLVAFSYLETYVKFREPYRQYDKAMFFTDSAGNRTPVNSFGVWDGFQRRYRPLCKQIDILYCKMDEDDGVIEFALDLCKHTEPYQLVVAITEPNESLEHTILELQRKIKSFQKDAANTHLAQFDKVDILQVPEMYWDITHHFAELEGKFLSNDGYQSLWISKALQMIRFRLDRTGALLESKATFAVGAIPKIFSLDRPFLIYLRKRDADQPFFAMWVDNAELLTPFAGQD